MQIDTTPWGAPETVSELAPGIYAVTTPSHGGIFLDEQANNLVPYAWRVASFNQLACAGWYEEDCDWSMAAIVHPYAFTPDEEAQARKIAGAWLDGKIGHAGSISAFYRNCGKLMDRRPMVRL